MNDPPAGMGAPGLRGATHLAHSPLGRGRAGPCPHEVGRGAPRAAGAPSPAAAAAGARGSAGGAREDGGAGEPPDSQSWVREKVLFLLHPERGLGPRGAAARAEAAGGEAGPQARAEAPERPAPHSPGGERLAGGLADAAAAAPPKSVLVRVEDYRATEEVQWTEWARGCKATRTEDRAVTVVTFRTNKK